MIELPYPPRFGTARNPERRTLGPEVCEVSRRLGWEPMLYQQYLWDVQYELDDDGFLFYRECRITVPRQSAKTTAILIRLVHRMTQSRKLGWGDVPVGIYTAQSASAARHKMAHVWMPTVERSDFDLETDKYFRGAGNESIWWDGGGSMQVVPPNETAGHGMTVDMVDLDEAFAYKDARAEQALRPAMITRPSPQITIQSTAGTVDSTYLWGKVDDSRARIEAGDSGPVCSFEWSCGPDDDIDNPDHWPRFMPALKSELNPGGTVPLKAIQIEHDTLPPDEFARAYGNIWTASVTRPISVAAWNRCLDKASQPGDRLWMAIDATPGGESQRRGSVSIAGRRADGLIHVETIVNEEGLGWIPDAVAKLTRKYKVEVLYLDTTGPIGSVLPAVRQTANANIELVDATQMANACTAFHEAAVTATLRHRGQDSLDAAVDGAAQRTLLDSWAWSRRKATTDISPLVSCTLAFWGCFITETGGRYEIF